MRDALIYLNLSDPDRDKRLDAVIKCGDSGTQNALPALKEMMTAETDTHLRVAEDESIQLIVLANADTVADERDQGHSATRRSSCSSRALPKLQEILQNNKDANTAKALTASIAQIESWQNTAQFIGYVFSGISLGSIMILMALCLSIIFGLMGVINMAHGELMMIGAYTSFMTQKAFEAWLPPAAFDYYMLIAIPVSFLAAALVGYLIELFVVRFLYGRPLETLLATFGVSLILIQAVRMQFGDNIAVNSPSWLQGGAEVMPDIVLPYNRCFIIGFCVLCIMLMYYVMARTKLGLLVARHDAEPRHGRVARRADAQEVDAYTFALGAEVWPDWPAARSFCKVIGGVTPDMGQNYIVDSFMVVVTGGVGKLAGAIWAGFGIGCLNKVFEPFFGAVWGRVLILICVVLFLQWRPSGLFPAKGENRRCVKRFLGFGS